MKTFGIVRTGLGQYSRRFLSSDSTKPCVIGGIIFDDLPGFQSIFDGDPVFGALTKALGTLTGYHVLDGDAENLLACDGISDSEVYLQMSMAHLKKQHISHVAISLEAKRPFFLPHLNKMKDNIARIMKIETHQVGITVISGQGLSDCGLGDGVFCTAIITTQEV